MFEIQVSDLFWGFMFGIRVWDSGLGYIGFGCRFGINVWGTAFGFRLGIQV